MNWDSAFMNSNSEFAKFSKCSAKKVACSLVKDGTVISIGINGTLSGLKNCCDIYVKEAGEWFIKLNNGLQLPVGEQEAHYNWSKNNEVHAEVNAIGKAAKMGISTDGATAYVTHSPCNHCALVLATAGVKKVVFKELYDAESYGLKVLKDYGVEVYHINDNEELEEWQC